MVACRIAVLLVAGVSAWTKPEMAAPTQLPTTPMNYTLHDEKECLASGKDSETLFSKYSGGAPTIGDCVKRCESMTGCIGFQFYYGKTAFGADQDFKCIGIAKANSCTVANSGDLKGGRKGNSFFTRDAGAVVAGNESARLPWQGEAPNVSDAKFLPFAGHDCSGGDDGELFAAKTNHTAEQCMAACKARATCAGFNYNFKDTSSTYQRCVGKKKDMCRMVGGREGMVYYADVNVYTETAGTAGGGQADGGQAGGAGSGQADGALPRGTTSILAVAVAMLLAVSHECSSATKH